jgi:FSR family fosmidomycin resistance protein-like MFS transporter
MMAGRQGAERTALAVLLAVSFSHFLNDLIQALLPALYPMFKSNFALSFGEVGLITLTYQLVASLLQPLIGVYADRRPKPGLLPVGMALTLVGLVLVSMAPHFLVLLAGAALVGMGSAVFHPESSRMARAASGGRHGFAQSLYQVGGAVGSAIGPLLAAVIVLPRGQGAIAWFSLAAFLAIVVLANVGGWYKRHTAAGAGARRPKRDAAPALPRRQVRAAIVVLLILIFSKYLYLSSLTSYYTFYLIHRFQLSVQGAQICLFVFLSAAAVGTFIGGPIGDRFGRKYVIWCSILGVLPFTMLLPYVDLAWTIVLSILIGLILSSAFSAIVVYGQELMPGRVGMVAGLFFGFAFGMGGIGAAALGALADMTSITFVYRVCAFLPLLGAFAVFLPNLEPARRRAPAASATPAPAPES